MACRQILRHIFKPRNISESAPYKYQDYLFTTPTKHPQRHFTTLKVRGQHVQAPKVTYRGQRSASSANGGDGQDTGSTPSHHDRYGYDMEFEHPHPGMKPRNLPLPPKARVIICGGGVIGSSVAYHLAEMGWKDILLLEQGHMSCGTTWHAVGLVGCLRNSILTSSLAKYSANLYRKFEEEDYGTGWKQTGSLSLCRTKDRLVSYKRALALAQTIGIEGEILVPHEIKDKCPHMRVDDLEGGIWLPNDGCATSSDVCAAFTTKAQERGVQIVEKCKVKRVLCNNRKVTGVDTDQGQVECEYFVNCSGQWAREIGQLSTPPVKVPLHSCEHYYIVTRPVEGIDRMMPVVRDYDGHVYFREWGGGLIGGGFEPEAKPIFSDGIPDKFEFQLLPEDWDHFQILLEQLLHRMPAFEEAEVRQLVNGPESFTPDGRCIVGEAPEVNNYFVAAGMNSGGIALAGGIGKLMAEWIIHGEPLDDAWSIDIRRFVRMHNNKKFLKDRVKETLGLHHVVGPQGQEAFYRTGRKLRTSPLFSRQEGYGAVFGQLMGYERPLWYHDVKDDELYYDVPTKPTYGKPPWFELVKSEYWACREGVAVIDMSTFTKFELRSAGTEVVDFLQYVCSNEMDQPVGSVIHTGMQNHNGGFENDCSFVRVADDRYFMIGPTAQQTRAFCWLEEHLPADGSVQLNDVTSMYTALNVIGPRAPELLSELTDLSLTKQDFPVMTFQRMDVGQASSIKAMRLTHSGEDGWMLYIPSEYALHVYDSLMSVGKNYGIRNAGYFALRALRIEKFFAYWGLELCPQTTPLECGRDFRVRYEKGNFIGHGALLRQKAEGIRKRLVQFLLEEHDLDNDLWPWGGEPIYRNGKYAGITTSASYGFTLDRHVCLGFVQDFDENTKEPNIINNDFILKNAKYEVEIAGKRFPAKASIYPPKLAPAEQLFEMRYKKGNIT